MTERLCGPDCTVPDMPHVEPEPDWIGDYPVMHGESEIPVPGSGFDYSTGYGRNVRLGLDHYCLCGHPNYLTCPEYLSGGGIQGMTIERADDESGRTA